MKSKSLAVVFTCFVSISLLAQSQEDHTALKNLLGDQKYTEIQSIGQDRIDLMAYLNRHGYQVGEAGEKDLSEYPDALEVGKKYPSAPDLTAALFESGELDLMAYAFSNAPDEFLYYRIGDTSMLLTILPREIALERMQDSNLSGQ